MYLFYVIISFKTERKSMCVVKENIILIPGSRAKRLWVSFFLWCIQFHLFLKFTFSWNLLLSRLFLIEFTFLSFISIFFLVKICFSSKFILYQKVFLYWSFFDWNKIYIYYQIICKLIVNNSCLINLFLIKFWSFLFDIFFNIVFRSSVCLFLLIIVCKNYISL